MRFVIQCILADNTDEKRIALRTEHLRYIEANKERIFCGGPTLKADGQPEMMLIIVNAENLASAAAFISEEPYNRAGLFSQVIVRAWRQILPEVQPGVLVRELGQN